MRQRDHGGGTSIGVEVAKGPSGLGSGPDKAPSDGASAEELCKGDFGDLYRDHYESQVRRAFLMIGCSAAANDLVADAFTAVFQRWDRLDDPPLYLSRCVLNGCRDWGRRKARWARLISSSSLDADSVQVLVAENDINGLGNVRGFERLDLAAALATLSHRQRAAIVLRFYGREPERSIAEILDCQPGTVGSLIHRGLDRLRKELL